MVKIELVVSCRKDLNNLDFNSKDLIEMAKTKGRNPSWVVDIQRLAFETVADYQRYYYLAFIIASERLN